MGKPKVSVIIPIYNTEKYLRECLDGIVGQTLKEIEIICVNDGSTDSSADILDDYAKKDDRITVVHQQNQYAGVARNNGMQVARGEYIIFLDSDDVFEKNMLERLYSHVKNHNLDIAVCRSDGFDDNTKRIEEMPWSIRADLIPKAGIFRGMDIERDYFHAFVWWPWDKLFKRSYIKSLNIEFQDLRTTNDLYFVCIAVLMAERISCIDDILIHHRGNIRASLSRTREESYNNFYLSLLGIRDYLTGHNLYSRYEQDFVNYFLNFSLWHLDTMKGKSYCLLYNALRNEWYKEMTVAGRNEEYFYDKKPYERLQTILREDLGTHLVNSFGDMREKLEITEKKLHAAEDKLNGIGNKLTDIEINLKDTEKKLRDTENRLKASKSRETAIKNSVSFRIGRALTWGPRKVRKLGKSL